MNPARGRQQQQRKHFSHAFRVLQMVDKNRMAKRLRFVMASNATMNGTNLHEHEGCELDVA
jgi:hypothetical protein